MAVCAALLALATVIRVFGALNDLWLDEVWSLKWVGAITAPWQVFTGIHHDNNHYLMTLWMYLLGPWQRFWIVYRIPSIAAGIGTVALAGQIARRWGQAGRARRVADRGNRAATVDSSAPATRG